MPEMSEKLESLDSYAFKDLEDIVEKLKSEDIDVIDFGVGDPTDPTQYFIINALYIGARGHRSSGYPSYIGMPEYREAVSEWFEKRFGVSLNPDTQITSTIGSKEGIYNFPAAFLNPGDIAIMPSPGYPPYKTGTVMAGGEPYYTPLLAENDFLPDLDKIPEDVREKAKIFWINYPNNPTTATADLSFYRKLIEFCKDYDIIIASDEAYSEMYRPPRIGDDISPRSILEAVEDIDCSNIVIFNSLSKRSNMTGYRIGFVAGDRKIISAFEKLKTNIDSGTPNFVQEAAIAALKDDQHDRLMRAGYDTKRKIMLDALETAGFPRGHADSTFYIWQPVPEGMDDLEVAKKLLAEDIAVVAMPGSWISEKVDGINPGAGYLRFALVPSIDKTEEAAERIVNNLKF